MTRFEYVTKNARRLTELLELVCDDALVAKGCSLDILLPPNETGNWEEWLNGCLEHEDEIQDELTELARMVDHAAMDADY